MGLTLSDANPLPTRLKRSYLVKRLMKNTFVSYGPYSCERIPISGNDRMGLASHLIDADERVFFPVSAVVAQNDTIRCLETNQTWTVLFVVPLPYQWECFVKRSVAPVAGTKTN
jgi:hypothetical protein